MTTNNLKKACTETLIIKLLDENPMHGYEMAKEIERRSQGYFEFKHGTLYPLLHRLEEQGLIKGEWSTKEERPRKYYRLTRAGRRAHEKNTVEMQTFFRVMLEVMPEAGR